MSSTEADLPEPVLDAIYAAVRLPTAWPDLVRTVAEWIGAEAAIALVPTVAGYKAIPLLFWNVDLTPVAAAYPRYLGTAPWTSRALATGRAPGVFTYDELMPPEEQAADPYFQDIVAPYGWAGALFVLINLPGEFNAPPVVLNFYRNKGSAPFDRAHMERLERLLPHLRRVVRLNFASADPLVPDELRETLAAVGAPALAMGADGRVLFQNPSALGLLSESDCVSLYDGRLRFADRDAQRAYDSEFAKVTQRATILQWRPRAVVEVKRLVGPPLLTLITPIGDDLPSIGVELRPRALVFLLDGAWRPSAASFDILRRSFALTGAEIDIVADLSGGLSPSEIAKKRGVKVATVQTQIKAALSKTGLSRQSALVALVERLRV